MKREQIIQAVKLAEMLASRGVNSYVISDLYMHLVHLSKRLSTIDVQSCNGTRSEDSYRKAWESVNNRLAELLTPYRIYWYHQLDPRGASLYISNEYKLDSVNYTNGLAIY